MIFDTEPEVPQSGPLPSAPLGRLTGRAGVAVDLETLEATDTRARLDTEAGAFAPNAPYSPWFRPGAEAAAAWWEGIAHAAHTGNLQGAATRRAAVIRAGAISPAALLEAIDDSTEELRFLAAGMREQLAGNESLSVLQAVAITPLGDATVFAGQLARDLAPGVDPVPPLSGRDAEITRAAGAAADTTRSVLAVGGTVVVVVAILAAVGAAWYYLR